MPIGPDQGNRHNGTAIEARFDGSGRRRQAHEPRDRANPLALRPNGRRSWRSQVCPHPSQADADVQPEAASPGCVSPPVHIQRSQPTLGAELGGTVALCPWRVQQARLRPAQWTNRRTSPRLEEVV